MTETKSSINLSGITFIVCVTIFAIASIAGISIYNINDRNNMAKNIEAAISKGVDPMSVKCSYDTNTTHTCMAYALAQGKK